jgi:hypothetical protein
VSPGQQVEPFRIVFRDIAGVSYRYYVCTLLGERKALVIAATFHDRTVAETNRVYEVADLTRVDGDKPERSDLVDRAEW